MAEEVCLSSIIDVHVPINVSALGAGVGRTGDWRDLRKRGLRCMEFSCFDGILALIDCLKK